MKTVITVLVTLLMGQMALANNSLYRRAVILTDKIDVLERDLSDSQVARLEILLDEASLVLAEQPGFECGNSNDTFREAFVWANSPVGMGLTRSSAQQLARTIADKACSKMYLGIYSGIYDWAASPVGMGLTRSSARSMAKQVADYEETNDYSKSSLVCMKKEYEFASSPTGMGLTRSAAKSFAIQACLN